MKKEIQETILNEYVDIYKNLNGEKLKGRQEIVDTKIIGVNKIDDIMSYDYDWDLPFDYEEEYGETISYEDWCEFRLELFKEWFKKDENIVEIFNGKNEEVNIVKFEVYGEPNDYWCNIEDYEYHHIIKKVIDNEIEYIWDQQININDEKVRKNLIKKFVDKIINR